MLNHTLPAEVSVILQMSKLCIITSIYTALLVVGEKNCFSYVQAQSVTELIQEPHQVAPCSEQPIKIQSSCCNYFLLQKVCPTHQFQTMYKELGNSTWKLKADGRVHLGCPLKSCPLKPVLSQPLEEQIKRRIREKASCVSQYNLEHLQTPYSKLSLFLALLCRPSTEKVAKSKWRQISVPTPLFPRTDSRYRWE